MSPAQESPTQKTAMSIPTPNNLTDTPAQASPCALTKNGILEYLRSLRPQDGGAYADAVIELAHAVQARQWEIACEEWHTYTLWSDEAGLEHGVKSPEGHLRRVQRSFSCDHKGQSTHWHVATDFMPAISAINRALTDIEYRYAQRSEQVKDARPQPKHAYILRMLLEEAGQL